MVKYRYVLFEIKIIMYNYFILSKKGGTRMRKYIIIFFSIMLIISITSMVHSKIKKEEDIQVYEQLQEIKDKQEEQYEIEYEKEETEYDTLLPEKITVPEQVILPEYEELYNQNSDLFGWIKIDGTEINYPVMHTPETPNFYINKNWNKEESISGTICLDYRTSDATENIILYGHNMKDMTMFGCLINYKFESYYEQHKYIEFDTIYEKATYEIIAVSKAVIYYEDKKDDEYLFYEHVELDTKEEFDAYIQNAKQNSYYEISTTAEYGDQIITLCTCDYWTENARLLVIAKKI